MKYSIKKHTGDLFMTTRGFERHGSMYLTVTAERRVDHAPPTSYTWHDPAERDRYLDGHSRTKHGKEFDSRRQNLYNAERAWHTRTGKKTWATVGRERACTLGDLENVAAVVGDIMATAWWQRRYRKIHTRLYPGTGARRAVATWNGYLRFPRGMRNRPVVLHELIHLTVPKPHAGHGRLYAARFLEIVGWFYGDHDRDVLKDCYREHNVKWYPNRTAP